MITMIRNTLAVTSLVSVSMAGYASADEPTNFDYTGLPVTTTEPVEAVEYTTIPARFIMPECVIVENNDDYTGVDATRCKASPEPEPEWSYLY